MAAHTQIQHEKLKACKAADWFKNIIVGGDEVVAGRKEKPDKAIFLKVRHQPRRMNMSQRGGRLG